VVDVDHSPRFGDNAFTDHSGLVLRLPVTLEQAVAEEQDTLFSLLPEPVTEVTAREYQPHKTAMSRRAESSYARFVGEVLAPRLGLKTVLDHGCGRGSDVEYYRSIGMIADGWDPHPGFGATTEPQGQYDMVTSVFVLNVLPDPWQRIRALQHAAGFLKPHGHLLVVVRSPADIAPRAASAAWAFHHDGYWSSPAKGTFQKGITAAEIIALAWHAGLTPVDKPDLPSSSTVAAQALLSKRC
jgi:SAM-dependent methyltransferase